MPVTIVVGQETSEVFELIQSLQGRVIDTEGDLVGIVGSLLSLSLLFLAGSCLAFLGSVVPGIEAVERYLKATSITLGIGLGVFLKYMNRVQPMAVLKMCPHGLWRGNP